MRRHAQVQRPQPAVDEEAVERPRHGAHRVLHELAPSRAAPDRARSRRRRRRPSARRGTSSSSARRRRRRAPAAAGAPAWRTCCRPRPARRACARSPPARSITFNEGFVGVSTQISAVSSRTTAASASRSRWSTMSYSTPKRDEHLVDEPVRAAVEVVRQHDVPAAPTAVITACSAAMPEENARRQSSLQLTQRRFQRRARRVRAARVVELPDELAGRRLHVGRRLVDRAG